ncbi:phosphate ABC transporter permease subunit PstC [Sulfurospirillum diekertiae]|uniref:Phosphate transport system permease protein n=1 Tax=Sulfurospirillum diekertiae TaxID=1854492 RepID=A0A1Y0HQE2_9BACT|nr:phosphate ABC transporter permease subunit PstC [Sulfurospirillum diekertiae]ARU49555.1 Phosphate transport system permease protein PstC [Sulfurospirillum diekertiae]ASC94358.1 Phosphate transport system permease protein PstC [Sulfurospirillum diekertiae]ATB70415.1 Phosphate transport system permease protein PstC [Sulfurospirillum diekertiae]QIR75482.1 phosphate ABC transporter permease subunit PstC [Sulfurospirillum diekertiae]QIR78132.1 phosphate ABC transporter permease subunit PstC [Sul
MKNFNVGDFIFENLSRVMSLSVLLILVSIFYVLYDHAKLAIDVLGLKFIFDTDWAPNLEKFGAFPAIYGTLSSTTIAMVLATPIALGIAIFLSEIARGRFKALIGTMIELLAAIPSIVYGMWGLFFFVPIIQKLTHSSGIGTLTASVILAIMIIPFTAAVSRDAMDTTPDILKESAYALGATKWDVIKDVIIPFAKVGVIGSIILSLGRALGETMAVTFVMGNSTNMPSSILQPATSIPVILANEFSEADGDLYYSSLFYLALILFVVSFSVIAVAKFAFLRKVRKNG